MNTKVIMLNGPPGCGKDTLGAHLLEGVGGLGRLSYKDPLYALLSIIYQLNYEDVLELCTNRELKESPNNLLGGLTPRGALIRMSETVIKPTMGEDFFGKNLANRLYPGRINVITDGGFEEEVPPIIEAVGKENALLLRIRGRGTFEGDSRNYLFGQQFGHTLDVSNIGTEGEFLAKSLDLLTPFMQTKVNTNEDMVAYGK